MFDEFQTTTLPKHVVPRSKIYDVFVAIRDDELEHVKTMIACQQPGCSGNLQSPHAANRPALPESIQAAIDTLVA